MRSPNTLRGRSQEIAHFVCDACTRRESQQHAEREEERSGDLMGPKDSRRRSKNNNGEIEMRYSNEIIYPAATPYSASTTGAGPVGGLEPPIGYQLFDVHAIRSLKLANVPRQPS